MQDQQQPQELPFPPELLEQIAAADVLILIGSSEEHDKALKVRTVLPGVPFEPEQIAAHAYALAVNQDHEQLMRKLRGQPTDAQRYGALRQFASLAHSDPSRFKTVNEMLQKFEDASTTNGSPATGAEHDTMADFLLHALVETEPGGEGNASPIILL